MTRITVFLLIFLFVSPAAMAQDVPVPAQHPKAELERKRTESEAKKKELEREEKKAQGDLASTQKDLVAIAKDVKGNEARLLVLDKRMSEGRKEQAEIEARLKKDRSSIGDLVLALERLDRTPPEAVLARPGAPLETAQSAMLLQSILPNIYGRAESLKKDLYRLDKILTQLRKDQAEVQTATADLKKRQNEMTALLQKRKDLVRQTQSGIQIQEAALREISREAENLKELVARIEERERQAREAERVRLAAAASSARDEPVRAARARPTPIPKAGSAQLPVSGTISVGYGETDDIGAKSQGLTITGRSGALVVTPMGGVIRYAGAFKNYGLIIIVEHQKDYHSLIAGLARIDTVVGQSVSAGEPVGILEKSAGDGANPSLYYELRHQGQPVNPSRKFSGL